MFSAVIMTEFETFLKSYLDDRKSNQELSGLFQSIEYTLFSSGKRFRPALVFAYCEALDIDYKESFPLASSIEMIHTASLIHDDLPAMDDDSQRRGKLSNHKAFGEDVALLSADSLFVEAFRLLSFFKQTHLLIEKVSSAASISGMMGGQFLDLKSSPSNKEQVQQIHLLKTGALLQVCLDGVLSLKSKCSAKEEQALRFYSDQLSLLFQAVDDLQDQDKKDKVSLLSYMESQELRLFVKSNTDKCLESIQIFGSKAHSLKQIALFNLNRTR